MATKRLYLLPVQFGRTHSPSSFAESFSRFRCLHSSPRKEAIAHPVTAHGPPPNAPLPAASQYGDRVDRKRRQAQLLRQGQELKANQSKKSPLKKRFWKDVHIKEVPEGLQIHLDSRPVRTPSKGILTIPSSKPHLASAIALEWDLLTSAQQALRQHLVPMTSIAARSEDIMEQDKNGTPIVRQDIVKNLMGYLDTDTLLCWAPPRTSEDVDMLEKAGVRSESLRDIQIRVAQPIIGFLTTNVWPGIEIKPVLEENSIVPTPQSQVTKDVIMGWIYGLPAYELAALERAVLAAKSLLVAARLVIDWSESFRHLQSGEQRFGIEEAAQASSLEVRWQTDMWGEVEDTHDVDREDLRRQLGSAVLLVSGTGSSR